MTTGTGPAGDLSAGPARDAALRRLATDYAWAADSGDGALLAATFLPTGRLRVLRADAPDAPRRELSGSAQLATVPARLAAAHDRTFHLLGQSRYGPTGERVTGVVYCDAHHLTGGPEGGTSYVMHIRYQDRYAPDDSGLWRIEARDVIVQWTETRPVDPPGT